MTTHKKRKLFTVKKSADGLIHVFRYCERIQFDTLIRKYNPKTNQWTKNGCSRSSAYLPGYIRKEVEKDYGG